MAILDDLIKEFKNEAFNGKKARGLGQKEWIKKHLTDFDEEDELLLSIALAHNDMARRAQGHTDEVKKESLNWWRKYFDANSPFKISAQGAFDKWHFDACEAYCEHMKKEKFPKKFDITFGRAQKVLNMTFKYLYCTGTYKSDVEKLVSFLHMTLDGYTLRWYKEQIVKLDPSLKVGDVSEWSKMNEKAPKHKYIDLQGDEGIQNRIRKFLSSKNIYEYIINTEEILDDEEGEKKNKKELIFSQGVSPYPFLAEFIIWKGEIIRAKMETLFKGLNGCRKSWSKDSWAIDDVKKEIKKKLKDKMDEIYPLL